ncbi:MAG: hypothetical protein FWG94_13415 [Oscillospiraceae bacterium]|nr:hypothetical protein [Oscillospiraceae bacterium]
MWKESYKIGNELVDAQHKELFERTGKLIAIIKDGDASSHKQECIDAILFLKDYALNHFATEEGFQDYIGYESSEIHKLIHRYFVATVVEWEQRMTDADFSVASIKEFCGFLIMWLTYHVAGADQKIITGETISYKELVVGVSYEILFQESIKDVLSVMLGESEGGLKPICDAITGDAVSINVKFDAGRCSNVIFSFSKETALNLVNATADMKLSEIDELAYAALSQLMKTISGNVVSLIAENASEAAAGLSDSNKSFAFDTKLGTIAITLLY